MARPQKRGLEYFPISVDLTDEVRFKKLQRRFGSAAGTIWLVILSRLFRWEGYYLEVGDDTVFELAEKSQCDEVTVKQFIEMAVELGFFDRELFTTKTLLTSTEIQETYALACSRRKNPPTAEWPYWIFGNNNRVNVDSNPVNDSSNPVNDGRSTQRKVKETKLKERVEESSSPLSTLGICEEGKVVSFIPVKTSVFPQYNSVARPGGVADQLIHDAIVYFDKEKEAFSGICKQANRTQGVAQASLVKFHGFCKAEGKYPLSRQQAEGRFVKWLMAERDTTEIAVSSKTTDEIRREQQQRAEAERLKQWDEQKTATA